MTDNTQENKARIRDYLLTVIISIAIAVAVLSVMKPTIVKETSMMPTLENNNYLIINKMSYIGEMSPEYEDIIVFHSNVEDKLLIKRVIGVEGDVISVLDGKVYRNGEALKEPYTFDDTTSGIISDFVVPEDSVFVLGDNRDVSIDSRDNRVGAVHEKSIVGKACLRLFPFNEITTL